MDRRDLHPRDVHVAVPTYALHHDERYWERPDEFWPERWLEEEEGGTAAKIVPDAFIPFSIGSFQPYAFGLSHRSHS